MKNKVKLELCLVRNENIYDKSREMLFKNNIQIIFICGTRKGPRSYQIENDIFYKSPTFVTDNRPGVK